MDRLHKLLFICVFILLTILICSPEPTIDDVRFKEDDLMQMYGSIFKNSSGSYSVQTTYAIINTTYIKQN